MGNGGRPDLGDGVRYVNGIPWLSSDPRPPMSSEAEVAAYAAWNAALGYAAARLRHYQRPVAAGLVMSLREELRADPNAVRNRQPDYPRRPRWDDAPGERRAKW